MYAYLARRLLAFIPILWVAVTAAFFALRLTPGDPVTTLYAESNLAAEQLTQNRTALGIGGTPLQQYLAFMANLSRGDLGQSLFSGRPVATTILEQLGPTAELALTGLGLATLLGFTLGSLAAYRPGTWTDKLSNSAIVLSLSLPVAWTGLLGLWLAAHLFAAASLPWLSLALPALVLGFSASGPIAGVVRSHLLAVHKETFLLAARARGVFGWRLHWHALRVALVPAVHMVALQAAFLFGGTVITETVFARPGLGRLFIDALLRKDYPVAQGLTLLVAGLYLLFNLIADLTTAWLDPRLRAQLH